MIKNCTPKIKMFLIYTICMFSLHSADLQSAREASFSASLAYIEGDYTSAGILFKKSLDFREESDPIRGTLLKLHLYSLWNSSKDDFCTATTKLSKEEKSILRGDASLLEFEEECQYNGLWK